MRFTSEESSALDQKRAELEAQRRKRQLAADKEEAEARRHELGNPGVGFMDF
jgi:hypothetical protein